MPEYEEYAKRVPAWIPKIRRQRKKVSKISLELVGAAIWFGLPILFVLDATMLRLGLLYSPYLSFFNSLDTYIQVLGLAVVAASFIMMLKAGYTLSKEVNSKAK